MADVKDLIEKNRPNLEKLFKKEGVVFAYLYGSASRGKMGPLSDIDVAVLFSEKVKEDRYLDKRLKIASEIDKILGLGNKTEVICLNRASSLLKHRAVLRGMPLFASQEKLKRDFELRVLQEYEDFNYHLATSHRIMEKHIKSGAFGRPLKLIY